MWLCPRHTSGRTARSEIPAVLHSALLRWYSGIGDDADHRASVMLVVAARDNHQWLACDCLADEAAPPLMSPAYLSIAETYYLRRLTSSRLDRPEHDEDCPFHRPQTAALRDDLLRTARKARHKGSGSGLGAAELERAHGTVYG